MKPTLRFSLSQPSDLAALAPRWRAMEQACGASFFQSWTWTGCLAEERFQDPVLLEGFVGERLVALALFNRRRGAFGTETLLLGESGDAGLDAIFIEHNGVLLAPGAGADAVSHALRAARSANLGAGRPRLPRSLVLSGVDAQHASAAGAAPQRIRAAPRVDLAALRRDGRAPIEALSANTRQQLRRSGRRYAQQGELRVTRAETPAEAQAFLDGLAALHQQTWTGRGLPGAFANPQFRRFHEALIARGLPRGEIDLLHVAAGTTTVGYLYNFRFGGAVSAYQSGFCYPQHDNQRKPGLTCHHLAIARCAAEGMDSYDFLAGDDRYKTSLANASTTLFWLRIGLAPAWLGRIVGRVGRALPMRRHARA